jgi:hypothetical protein
MGGWARGAQRRTVSRDGAGGVGTRCVRRTGTRHVLQGDGVRIDLVGDTFISKAGVTSSTFKTVPDQPVTSFELTLPEGPHSALAANKNLCALTKTVTVEKKEIKRIHGRKRTVTVKVKKTEPEKLVIPTEVAGQNGAVIEQQTPIAVTGCPKTPSTKTHSASRHTRSALPRGAK